MSFLQNLLGLGGAGDSLSQSMGLGGTQNNTSGVFGLGNATEGGGGLLGLNLFGVDNSMRLPLALSMMGGGSNSEAFKNAATLMGTMGPKIEEKRLAADQKNKTLEFLQKNNPEIAAMVEAGMPINEAWAQVLKSRSGGGTEYGLNPQYGVDAEGNPVLIQLGKDATGVQTKLPDGVRLSKEPIKLDAGTHFVLLDPITRQPIGQIPKDLAGAEAQKEIGAARGKSAASASADFQAASNALDLVDELMTDPNRARGSGASSYGNWIPATKGYDYQAKVDKAKAGAFLTAIQQLRGMGALSNAEGQVATQAVANLDTAQSEEAFLASLQAYRKIIEQGLQRAASAGGGGGMSSPGAPSGGGGVIDYQDYFKGNN